MTSRPTARTPATSPQMESADPADHAPGMLLKACVNGARDVSEHPRLSADARAVAADAAAAVAEGAGAIHVHPKGGAGRDSLAAGDVARWLSAMRDACPGVPIGATTGAWAAPEVRSRLAAIAEWTHLPDFASVNWHEDGADEVAALLLSRGVEVEAGVWNAEGAELWARSPHRTECLRVLIELPDIPSDDVRDVADDLIGRVTTAERTVPVLLHGEQRSTWAAFDLAAERRLDTRIGLEDCLSLPDGRIAPDNAALVRAAIERIAAR